MGAERERTSFRGVNVLSLDAKGRIVIPTKYRSILLDSCQGRVVITVDSDPCLLLYPLPEWETIQQTLTSLPNLDVQTRQLQRLLLGYASDCEMDGHGRILLPPALRGVARLEKRICLIGQGNKFELWDEQTWDEFRAKLLARNEHEQPLSEQLRSLSI